MYEYYKAKTIFFLANLKFILTAFCNSKIYTCWQIDKPGLLAVDVIWPWRRRRKKEYSSETLYGRPTKRWGMPFLDFSAKMTIHYLCNKGHSVTGLFQAHFLHSSLRSLLHVVGLSSDPSFFPLTGSSMTKMIRKTAIIPIAGVTRRPHLQDPDKFAVPDPTI